MTQTDSTGKNPDESGEESTDTLRCSQLTDKAEVVGLDTTDYGDERIQSVSRLSVATLKLQVELLDTLGWDTVDVLAVEPKDGQPTEHAVVAFRPPADGWFTEQAAVAAAPESQPHGETIFDPGDDEEDDELVTDGGEAVGDTETSIDTERGGDDYTELSITVSDDALEGLTHGSSATYEFPVENGGTLAVTVEGDGEFDKDWLLESIGAKEQPQPQPYKTIFALAVFGASLSVATMLSPGWAMIPAAVPMLLAGVWIIDEVRRGYDRGAADGEATA